MPDEPLRVFPEKHVEFKSNGRRLSGFITPPSSVFVFPVPGVILCHGFTNNKVHCPLINDATKRLSEAGFIVFRFDFYGSGESEGDLRDKTISEMTLNMRDALEFFKKDKRVDKQSIGLWGRSVGGTTAVLAGGEEGVKAWVLMSTSILLRKDFYYIFEKNPNAEYLALPEFMRPTHHGMCQKGPWELNRGFFLELEEMEEKVRTALKRMRNVCIIHGSKDEKVDRASAQTIYDMVNEPKEIHIIETKGHQYFGEHEMEFLEIGVNWLKKKLKGSVGD